MRFIILTILLLLALASGCVHVKVDPVEVKPITLNINLKIDRQLDDFFAFEKDAAQPAATQPTTGPSVAVPTTVPTVVQ